MESQGGKITCAYYTKLGLRVLLKPWKFDEKRMPRRAAPPPKLEKYYRDPSKRGYLADPKELDNERLKTYQMSGVHSNVDSLSEGVANIRVATKE